MDDLYKPLLPRRPPAADEPRQRFLRFPGPEGSDSPGHTAQQCRPPPSPTTPADKQPVPPADGQKLRLCSRVMAGVRHQEFKLYDRAEIRGSARISTGVAEGLEEVLFQEGFSWPHSLAL